MFCDGIQFLQIFCYCLSLLLQICACVCNIDLHTSIRCVTQEIIKLLFQLELQSITSYKFIADFNDIACKRGRYKSARGPTFFSSYWTAHCPLIPVSIKQCVNRQCRPDADVRATNFWKVKGLALNSMKENAALLTDFLWRRSEITQQWRHAV